VTPGVFAYAQARLQARHGERPRPVDWRRLQAVGDVVHYLQVARRTRLGRWVEELHGDQDSHSVELALRRQFCAYIDEVARWLPHPWRDTLGWLKRLPELPAIQYLLSGENPQPWMLEDPRLRAFTRGDREQRLLVLGQSDCAPLAAAWERGEPIASAWLEHWRDSWAPGGAAGEGLEQLTRSLRRFLGAPDPHDAGDFERARDLLLVQLTLIFRRYSFQPAACYAHLALTALDLMTLRADLLRRMLFTAAEAGPL
jgi:hypothetical protein